LACLILTLFTFSISLPSLTYAETASTQKQSEVKGDEKPVGAKSGEKGGIYTVGRAFKKAGTSMESGFKAAGRGIKKGGHTMGRGFKKAGRSIHDFFTGEKSEKSDK
jgi:hypothetical protein